MNLQSHLGLCFITCFPLLEKEAETSWTSVKGLLSFLQLPYRTTGSKQILSFTELSSNKWLLIPSFSSLLIVPNLGCFSLSLNSYSKELLCPISSVMPPLWSQFLYQILSTFHTLSNIIFMCAFLSFHLTCKFLKGREHELDYFVTSIIL